MAQAPPEALLNLGTSTGMALAPVLAEGVTADHHGKALAHQVLALIGQPAPLVRGRWTGKLAAQALGVLQQAVARALRVHGIHLARERS